MTEKKKHDTDRADRPRGGGHAAAPRRTDRHADELQEVIDRLVSGAAPSPGSTTPTGSRGESLREAVHRRMRELDEECAPPAAPRSEEEPGPDDEDS